jgi:hypothetical protein
MKEHDLIELLRPIADYDLRAGAVGTVVHVHADRAGIEAEFCTRDGRTRVVMTLAPDGYRVVRAEEGLSGCGRADTNAMRSPAGEIAIRVMPCSAGSVKLTTSRHSRPPSHS